MKNQSTQWDIRDAQKSSKRTERDRRDNNHQHVTYQTDKYRRHDDYHNSN